MRFNTVITHLYILLHAQSIMHTSGMHIWYARIWTQAHMHTTSTRVLNWLCSHCFSAYWDTPVLPALARVLHLAVSQFSEMLLQYVGTWQWHLTLLASSVLTWIVSRAINRFDCLQQNWRPRDGDNSQKEARTNQALHTRPCRHRRHRRRHRRRSHFWKVFGYDWQQR